MRITLLFLCLLPFSIVTAQVQFSDMSFEKACRQAARQQKVVMVVVESATCVQCNEVAQRGLSHPDAFAINAMAIALLVRQDDEKLQKHFSTFFTGKERFGLLFFNGDGQLIHRWNRSTTSGQEYVAQATTAYKKRSQPPPDLAQLEQLVQQAPANSAAVLELYKARKEQGVPVQHMADAYARATTPAWLDSATIIRTLFKLEPVLGTYADSMMWFANKALFNKLWYQQPLAERIEINREIVNRTGKQAVAEKNRNLAIRNAGFAASVMDNAPPAERRMTMETMMAAYFKNVKDTATYLTGIESMMTQYFMRLNADSVARADSMARSWMLHNLSSTISPDSVWAKGGITTAASFEPKAQFIARNMNNYCWDVYKMRPNSRLSQKAIAWAAHGLRICEIPELYNTYARLLYADGKKEEAIAAQEKAIALTTQHYKLSANNFIKVLDAMKAGQSVLDLE